MVRMLGCPLLAMDHNRLSHFFPERATIWDAVSSYVREQLLQHKGVRIPSLGTLDVVQEKIQVGDELVTIHRPTFSLARNLALVHNLMGNKLYAPGNKELEPLKYSKVASSIPTSRQKVERCVQGTMSQLSYCLGKGETVALVLKDIGVLLIEGKRVEVRFYSHFLEELVGKRSLEKGGAKVPHLLDMGMSPSAPVASLSTIGRVLVFPAFGMTSETQQIPKVLLKSLGSALGEDEEMGMGRSPSLDDTMEGKDLLGITQGYGDHHEAPTPPPSQRMTDLMGGRPFG
ncbi:coiled-coil domain-containing protein 81-like [Pezoporus wallicus]|uniref:coiled-coil domain-containing protein 81-like n=1 Tax=Pezoporus wallicus TaxID=35540 RepID=UPI0025514AE2|nr:coiled-coil domain-containing protein 81-like [Pezoporus wallicus]